MYLTKTRQSKFVIKQIFEPEQKIKRILPVYTTPNNEINESTPEALEPQIKKSSIEEKLDLNGYLISHPGDTFIIKIEGESAPHLGVYSGDILIIEQRTESRDGKLVVGTLNNKFTIKFLKVKDKQLFFAADLPGGKDSEVKPDTGFEMWGMVSYIIHKPGFGK